MTVMHLYLYQPPIVFAARVNQATFTYPLGKCTYDTVTTGAYGDVRENMTITFGTVAGGDDLGRQRIRVLPSSTEIHFGRSSRGVNDGEVSLQDNAYITVLEDYRVWAKIPYIDENGAIFKDHELAMTDETIDIPPKANGGGGYAATVDSVTGKITVTFSAAASYSLVSTIALVAWEVEDGTITVGDPNTTNITVTFPAGFRYVNLIVVDGNGNYHTTHIPVYARNPAADTTIQAFTIENHTIRKEGQQIAFRILSDIPVSGYPDGTLVMLWEDEPTTAADRSHMRFVGWHHVDPATINGGRTGILQDVTFECLDVAGRLDILPGFPISVEGKASPASWLEMLTPNMDKYIDYILRWHSTAFEVADITMSGTGSDYPFVILGSDSQSLWDQAARRCQSLVPDYILTCDTKGRIRINPDPIIQAVADRTGTVQAAILESDWSDINYTHQRTPRVHWLRSEAVLASASALSALFSVAPDATPGQGESEQTNGEQLARNQSDLNTCEGNRYARLNATESYFNIVATWASVKYIEPSLMTWVSLTISAANAAQRGLSFTSERGIIHEMNVRYQQGKTGIVRDVSLMWEKETDGLPAITYTPPDTDFVPPYEPPPNDGYDPTPPPGMGDGFGSVYVMVSGYFGRTRAFSASSPAWADIKPSGVGTMLDFILDPYNPHDVGFLLASDGVYRSSNLTSASPAWEVILTAAAANTAASTSTFTNGFGKVLGSINLEGYLAVFWVGDSTKLYCSHTTTAKDTTPSWTHSFIATTTTNFSGRGWAGGADIVPHAVGSPLTLYVTYNRTGGTGGTTVAAKSTNGGTTWAETGTVTSVSSNKLPYALHCPYSDNAAGDVVAVMAYADTTSSRGVYVSTNGGATFTQKYSGAYSAVTRQGVETYTLDRQKGYFVTTNTLSTTDDFYDNNTAAAGTGLDGNFTATGGFPTQSGQFYCLTTSSTGGIYVSTDRGANWVSKIGDWRTVMGLGFIAFSATPAVIVPLWLVE